MSSIDVTVAALPDTAYTACWIEVNRPRRANAMDLEAFELFNQALQSAAADPKIDAVIVTASGVRHFSGGADLSNRNADDALTLRKYLGNTLAALFAFPKPAVGAVNGVAVGAGAMLALALDRAVIAEEAYMSMPEIDIGIAPVLVFELLRELGGAAIAREIAISGARIDASRCAAMGLVAAAVPQAEVRSRAELLAIELCKKPREPYREFKLHLGRRMGTLIRTTLGLDQIP